MSAISELVDVKFVDNTNYVNTSGSDVIGCIFDHCWGPVGQMVSYSQLDFFNEYPEGLPYGWNPKSSAPFYSYAQIKRAFAAAGSAGVVEAYRTRGNWKYLSLALNKDTESSAPGVAFQSFSKYSDIYNDDQFPESASSILQIALRYPGFFPHAGSFAAYIDFKLQVTVGTESSYNPITIKLYGVSEYGIVNDIYDPSQDKQTLLESFYGSFDPTQVVDSTSFFIRDVVNNNSQYIRININDNSFYGIESGISITETYLNSYVGEDGFRYSLLSYDDIYGDSVDPVFTKSNQYFAKYASLIEDSETSFATLYIAPIPFKGTLSGGAFTADADTLDLFKVYADVCESRKDVSFIWGYPTDSAFAGVNFTKANIKAVGSCSQSNAQSMDTAFFAGREQYYVYGMLTYLDCTAGVAGRTVAVAKSSHVNQLASARQYGSYPGTLTDTLSFSDVNDLHQNSNINSVYSTPNGNYIWGIKNNYPRTNSYFSKLNVSRVVNALLKRVYPQVLNAIHTETVSDDFVRLQFLSAIKDILSAMVSAGNIKEQSDVTIETDDTKTRGGEEIILYFDIYFKKLSEHCTITITATDSSVSATIQ